MMCQGKEGPKGSDSLQMPLSLGLCKTGTKIAAVQRTPRIGKSSFQGVASGGSGERLGYRHVFGTLRKEHGQQGSRREAAIKSRHLVFLSLLNSLRGY